MEAIVLAIALLAVFALGLLAAGAAWLYEAASKRATDYKVCLSDLFLTVQSPIRVRDRDVSS